jgi:formylglycine-generating enzyme required for sulfatase activity
MLGILAGLLGLSSPFPRVSAAETATSASASSAALPADKPVVIADLKLRLMPIPAGSFTMGSSSGELGHRPDETPHQVTLTEPFWIGATGVTQAQYEAVMGTNPARFKGPDLPVETVNWDESMDFCRKLTERERAAGRLPAGFAYTLPTEAQREYACRAGTSGPYAGEINAIAWYSGNSDEQPHAVGQKQPNAWGLYDMQGDVWEWCSDWYGNYPRTDVTDPTGPAKGDSRVYRGGAWFHSADLCRSAYRYKMEPSYRGSLLGLRIVLVRVP